MSIKLSNTNPIEFLAWISHLDLLAVGQYSRKDLPTLSLFSVDAQTVAPIVLEKTQNGNNSIRGLAYCEKTKTLFGIIERDASLFLYRNTNFKNSGDVLAELDFNSPLGFAVSTSGYVFIVTLGKGLILSPDLANKTSVALAGLQGNICASSFEDTFVVAGDESSMVLILASDGKELGSFEVASKGVESIAVVNNKYIVTTAPINKGFNMYSLETKDFVNKDYCENGSLSSVMLSRSTDDRLVYGNNLGWLSIYGVKDDVDILMKQYLKGARINALSYLSKGRLAVGGASADIEILALS